ncbi:hypothetical protein CHUAL_002032 [Chamberlinius hualienensis]
MSTAVNDSANFTVDDVVYPSLVIVSAEVQAVIIGLYSLTAVFSLVGNVTVVVVLLLGKRSSKGIRHFLVNLAVSDIVMAVFCIPFTYTSYIFGEWIFEPDFFCTLVLFMQHVAVTVSVYTLTAIGVDRYMAIMHPLHFRSTKSYWPALLVLGLIWGMAIMLSGTVLVHGKAKLFQWDNATYHECLDDWPSTWGETYTVIMFIVTFALPLTILSFTYSSIAYKMWRHTSPGNADADRDQLQLQAKTKVIKMLSLVVFLFAVCWCPLHIYTLFIRIDKELMMYFSEYYFHLNFAIFICCHWLAMANSFVNPIVYCFMNDNFWSDLRLILQQCTKGLRFRRTNQQSLARGRCLGSFRSTTYVLSFRTPTGTTLPEL